MCLFVNKEATEKFLSKHKNHKTVTVYKILERSGTRYITPYRFTPVTSTEFKAKKPLKTIKQGRKLKSQGIGGGGIHCYIDYQRARYQTGFMDNLFKCTALMEDLIAVGSRKDAVFTKIKLPKRVLNGK